ncbi:unnamed protein product [Rotaria sp. Silwood2]|nr:unnamed protein product [Rotaria sp. Silwood2]CAF4190114.1 unnamed protein product [Rotaria sp. Silwood2]
MPCLERFSFFGDISCRGDSILHSIFDTKHFPSLKVCQFSDRIHHTVEFHKHYQSPNNTIRTLILHISNISTLGPLLNLLPNLRRFETSLVQCANELLNFNTCHISLKHLRISLVNPSNDLEKILPHMPNLKQLRVTGIIRERLILEHFEKLNYQRITRMSAECYPVLSGYDTGQYSDVDDGWF